MRIVWFVSTEFPAVCRHLGINADGGGWWMVEMAKEITKSNDIKLCVVTLRDYLDKDIAFNEDGIEYRVVGPHDPFGRLSARIPSFGFVRKGLNALREFSVVSVQADLSQCRAIVDEFDAEIVTVWGSEKIYGLVSRLLTVPVVLWIQGLTGPYRNGFWGTFGEFKKLVWLSNQSNLRTYFSFWESGRRERDILRCNEYFIGRTAWDKSWLFAIRLGGVYYHCDEILRPAFLKARVWSRNNCVPYVIYTTSDASLRKGTDLLVEALKIIACAHNLTTLRIGGISPTTPRGKQIRKAAARLGVADKMQLLGYLKPDEMVLELQRAHVFVLTSFAENSCNALAEAQAVGTPCVASFAGGTSSLVKHGESGVLYPTGDWACLAGAVLEIFADDNFALHLSHNASNVARCRHNPIKIAERVLEIYREVIHSSKRRFPQVPSI